MHTESFARNLCNQRDYIVMHAIPAVYKKLINRLLHAVLSGLPRRSLLLQRGSKSHLAEAELT